MSKEAVSPRRYRSRATTAIIAALSVHAFVGGTVTRTPWRDSLSTIMRRRCGLAATPPPMQYSFAPVSRSAFFAFLYCTSNTAASKEAARSGRWIARPAFVSFSIYSVTAVFKPESEKR